MEAIPGPAAPVQTDFRAELHQLIDRIQDEAVLRAAVLLLTPQAVLPEAAPELSPAWQKRLEVGVQQLDAGQGIPALAFIAKLRAETAR